jgi:hypothetical protein
MYCEEKGKRREREGKEKGKRREREGKEKGKRREREGKEKGSYRAPTNLCPTHIASITLFHTLAHIQTTHSKPKEQKTYITSKLLTSLLQAILSLLLLPLEAPLAHPDTRLVIHLSIRQVVVEPNVVPESIVRI